MTLEEVVKNDKLLEIGRKAIEDALVTMRNSRTSELFRNNGLVVKEPNGEDSHIIRFGPEVALQIGLKAIIDYFRSENEEQGKE